MKKLFVFISFCVLFFACEKEKTGACISSCNSSTPGKINIAIEEHTNLNISNVILTINKEAIAFDLIPKKEQGNYSCWATFDKIETISLVEFSVGTEDFSQVLNYENLTRNREFSIDIQFINEAFRFQLVQSPDCVSDED